MDFVKEKNNKKMKILIATPLYPPDIGGPATYSKMLKDGLPATGINVEILSFGSVRRFPKIIRHIFYFFKVLNRGKKVDAVFAQDPVSVGLPTCLACFFLRKRFFIRIAGDYAWEQSVQRFGVKENIDEFQNKKYGIRVEFLRKIQKSVANRSNGIITPSEYFQKLVSDWVKDSRKVIHIYNGVKEIREPEDITYEEKEKMMISAGRLVPWKGFDTLIDLMKDLNEWRLVIAGDGPYKSALEEKIKKANVENRVDLTGSIPRESLMKKINEARIFVLNTSFESFSFQVVESMYIGTPVITTNIGNLKEIIEDGKEGVLVEPNDKKSIKIAVEKIDNDNDFRKKIIENAKEKSKEFSIDKTLNNLASFFKERI